MLKFKVIDKGKPIEVKVTREDGSEYVVRIAIGVADIDDTGRTNPLTDMPVFNVSSSIGVEVKKP